MIITVWLEIFLIEASRILAQCHMLSLLVQKLYPCSNIASQPYKLIFLTTYLMVVIQPSEYSVFYNGDTPILLGLP